MKNLILFISSLSGLTLVSTCASHEQPAESAFERVKHERMMTLDSAARSEELTASAILPETDNKILLTDSWEIYQDETGQKIGSNDRAIQKIKLLPDLTVGMFKKANMLQENNNTLKLMLDSSDQTEKKEQDNFKSKMDSDLLEVSSGIENLRLKYAGQL